MIFKHTFLTNLAYLLLKVFTPIEATYKRFAMVFMEYYPKIRLPFSSVECSDSLFPQRKYFSDKKFGMVFTGSKSRLEI